MTIETIFQSRLLFVSGKGGVGKTSFASSLALASSDKGKKGLLVEIDNIHPSTTNIFGIKPEYNPTPISKNLSIANITWKEALKSWLTETIKSRTIVQMILGQPIAMIFLDATPGAREIVILAKLVSLLEEWDQIIVDLPASGHALGILRVPKTAQNLMKKGPINEVSKKILKIFSQDTTRVVLVSLPEEMVINETIEFANKLHQQVPEVSKPIVVLNRMSIPTLSKDENTLLDRLKEKEIAPPEANELIEAATWERDLEQASQRAAERLQATQRGKLISFQRLGILGGYDGGPQKVIQQMKAALLRMAVR